MSRSQRLFLLVFVAFAAALIFACSKSPEPAAQQAPAGVPNTPEHMVEHFTRVREVEEAIIRGDLDDAKAPAQWIADHQETTGFPDGTQTPIMEMKAAAKSVATADNLGNAAVAAAHLVGTCGTCHTAAKVSPKLPPIGQDPTGKGRGRHMLEHQHAIDLMYRGLIVPSSGDWANGAKALKAAPLKEKELSDITKEATASEARVHELAERAAAAAEKSTRVAIYGSVIGACAECHGLHGRVWGPGIPKGEPKGQ
jgi:cytochrome c553